MITPNLTPERVEALRYVIDAGRLEVHYATSAHHYLANVGLLRKTTNLFRDPRYGKVPTEHGEPRGACSRCGRCATCDIYGPLAPKEGDPRMDTATRQNLEEKAAARIWTTREGEDIHVTAMEDHHLLAADRMLRRNGAIGPRTLRAYLTGPGPNGDAAQEAFDTELAQVLEAPVSPFLDHFEDEIKRRGLTRLEV